MSKHYCDSIELEEWWSGWNATNDERNWNIMSEMLYSICCGITKKFNPKSDEEFYNLANEGMTKLMIKIKTGKLKFKARCDGGSPVFNLVTTTVQRILFSYCNQQKNRKIRHSKYVMREVQEKAPELLSSVRSLYEI
jgi:hypothetical protein